MQALARHCSAAFVRCRTAPANTPPRSGVPSRRGLARQAGRCESPRGSAGWEEARMAQAAIVTGAASGIRRAMTLGLIGAGIDVVAADKEAAWLDELAAAAGAGNAAGRLHQVRADLTEP